jgi:hypothetical protein
MVDATEIFHDLCWLLECELATLEGLKDRKRVAKHDLERHSNIARTMVTKVWAYCRDYGFGLNPRLGRVVEAVAKLNEED